VLLEQHPPLAFGHAAPDTELHPVVERVGEALGDDRAVPTNDNRFPLRRAANEEFVGIDGATVRLRHPLTAVLGRGTTARTVVRNRHVVAEVVAVRCCGRDCGDQACPCASDPHLAVDIAAVTCVGLIAGPKLGFRHKGSPACRSSVCDRR
jgi:hypothetical protein